MGERVDDLRDHSGSHHPDTALAGVVGAYDWLFDPMADFPGGGDELHDGPVGHQEDHFSALDPSSELALAALSYATSTAVAGKRKSVRRKRLAGADAPWHEFFLLEEELFACEIAFDQVQAAITGDPWAMRWLMASDAPSRPGVPPRPLVLEIFEARDYVLQTRVAYEMWRHGQTALQATDPAGRFAITPLSRRFLFEITAVMSEHNVFDDPGHYVQVADLARANPGITEGGLRALFEEEAGLEPGLNAAAVVGRALSYMDLEHLLSQSAAGGWYFTGRNPIRKREELIEDRKTFGYGSINRSWSQWF
jgi:hypothetical protein